MNYKQAVIFSSALGASLCGAAMGCNRPENQEAEAREAQQEATKTAVEAQREANEQAVKAQAEVNEVKKDAVKDGAEAQAKVNEQQREANQKITETQQAANERTAEAQADANSKVRDAAGALAQSKADYRTKAQKEIADLKNSLDELRAKSVSAQGNAKVSTNASIRDVEARRLEVERQLTSLDTAQTSDEFNRRSAQLDKQIESLKDQVNNAENKL